MRSLVERMHATMMSMENALRSTMHTHPHGPASAAHSNVPSPAVHGHGHGPTPSSAHHAAGTAAGGPSSSNLPRSTSTQSFVTIPQSTGLNRHLLMTQQPLTGSPQQGALHAHPVAIPPTAHHPTTPASSYVPHMFGSTPGLPPHMHASHLHERHGIPSATVSAHVPPALVREPSITSASTVGVRDDSDSENEVVGSSSAPQLGQLSSAAGVKAVGDVDGVAPAAMQRGSSGSHSNMQMLDDHGVPMEDFTDADISQEEASLRARYELDVDSPDVVKVMPELRKLHSMFYNKVVTARSTRERLLKEISDQASAGL